MEDFAEPPPSPDEPSGNDIEHEFGVRIRSGREMGEPAGWWYAQVPGSTLWAGGRTLGHLRDELIRYLWLGAHGGE